MSCKDTRFAVECTEMAFSRVILLLFLTAQGFDGLFTYVAVHAYGVHAEGNVLIATWMAFVGPGAALFGAKTVAGACSGLLLYHTRPAPNALATHRPLRDRRHRPLADGVCQPLNLCSF